MAQVQFSDIVFCRATNVSDEKQEDSIAEEEAPDTVGEEILQAEGEEREEAEKE